MIMPQVAMACEQPKAHLGKDPFSRGVIIHTPCRLHRDELRHVARVQAVARYSAPIGHAAQGFAAAPVQSGLLSTHGHREQADFDENWDSLSSP